MGIMASSCPSDSFFDETRGCYVAATPEEHVRQKILKKMIHVLQFPRELIVVEKKLKELPHIHASSLPNRRIDILCYGKNIHPEHLLYPILLIECKKDDIDRDAEEQLEGYNTYVNAFFIALVNRDEERFGYLDKKKMRYVFHAGFPPYKDLISCIKH